MDLTFAEKKFPRQAIAVVMSAAIVSAIAVFRYKFTSSFSIEDDAYYYYMVARNIADHGMSSFDGISLTNGYHPLWQMIVSLEYFLFAISPEAILISEALLLIVAFGMFFETLDSTGRYIAALVLLPSAVIMASSTLNGMETALLTLAFVVFFREFMIYADRDRPDADPTRLALAVALCFFARIDSIVFVAPAALLASRTKGHFIIQIAVIGLCVGIYGGVNLWLFGIPFPVSGMIKSLGSPGLNEALIAQLKGDAPNLSGLWMKFWKIQYIGKQLALLMIISFLLILERADKRLVILTISIGIGLVLFWTKQVFFSSWRLWIWYDYPLTMELLLLAAVMANAVAVIRSRRQGRPVVLWAVALVTAVGAVSYTVVKLDAPVQKGVPRDFFQVNKIVAEKLNAMAPGARVAMGDRAGSFAYYYKGPVVQLEGLVNDVQYYEILKSKGDVNKYICSKNVQYFVSYHAPLSDYESIRIPVQRRYLTTYAAPSYRAEKRDQVLEFHDLSLFDNPKEDDQDSYVYVWRVRCGD